MSRSILLALLLGLCAWRTHARAEQWRDDEALWRSAAQTSSHLARPMVNLAAALVRVGRYEEAWTWVQRVEPLTASHRGPFTRVVRALHVVWQPVCDDPGRASWCAWDF